MNQNKQNEIIEELEHYISYRKEYCEKHFSKNPDVYLIDTYYDGRIDSYSECLDKIAEMKKDLCKEKEMIEHNDACTLIKNNAVKEFGEFVLSLFPSDGNFTTINRFTIKQKMKEMID